MLALGRNLGDLFLPLDELAEDPDVVMLVGFEVEAEALRKADLKEIVIEGLFGEAHLASRLF